MSEEVGAGSEVAAAIVVTFDAGDFVWMKIKGQQWWPGRVRDPSEAPDHVRESPRKDQRSVLVTCFGDGGSVWCNPSQLKGFADNFEQVVSSSSSKGFKGAVDDAVGEVRKCLAARLSCSCLPEEERSAIGEWFRESGKIENLEVDGFVSLVRDVAVDLFVVSVLEKTKLWSWVVALERGLSMGHQRKGVDDLVDKIDLDVPVTEEGKEGDEEGQIFFGGGVLKGPSNRGRKKRSMAVLIAQMDLDSVEVSDDDDDDDVEKNADNLDGGVKEEEVGSGRRERKKSKYLSPPYTDLTGGLVKSLLLSKGSEAKTRNAGAQDEEEEMGDVLLEVDGLDTAEVFSEFLAVAMNPLHLKENPLAKTVRGLFSEFRKSEYTGGAEFNDYQRQLTELGEGGQKTEKKRGRRRIDEVTGEGEVPLIKSEEGFKKSEGRRGRKKKDVVNDEGEASHVKSVETSKKTEGKRGRKRKVIVEGEEVKKAEIPTAGNGQMSKQLDKKEEAAHVATEGVNGRTPLIPKLVSGDGTSGQKRGRRKKSETNQNVTATVASDTVMNVQYGKFVLGQSNVEPVTFTKTPTELGLESCNQMRQVTSGRKRKNSEEGPIIDVPVNLGSQVINGSGEMKSRKKSKKRTNEDPAAVLVTFSPVTSLPSEEELISAFTKYGPVIPSLTVLLKESSTAKVVFEKSSDAEKAVNDKVAALGLPVASYQFCCLEGKLGSPSSQTPIPVPKPPLPYIRKSLERMISSLSGSAPGKVVGTPAGLKPETRDNLVGEMQGLLLKVDKMLTGPAAAAGTST